jgi:hypothetical protein
LVFSYNLYGRDRLTKHNDRIQTTEWDWKRLLCETRRTVLKQAAKSTEQSQDSLPKEDGKQRLWAGLAIEFLRL